MTQEADPLTRLVVDQTVVDRELLANLLNGLVRLDLGRGTFTFLAGVRDRLGARGLVLAALLAQKALHLLDNRYTAGLAPRELEAATGIRGGTLRPTLKRLGTLVDRNEEGVYTVPAFALEDVGRDLSGERSGIT